METHLPAPQSPQTNGQSQSVQSVIAAALQAVTTRRERLEKLGQHLADAKKAEAGLLRIARDLGMPGYAKPAEPAATEPEPKKAFQPTPGQTELLTCLAAANKPMTIAEIKQALGKEEARGLSMQLRSLVINKMVIETTDEDRTSMFAVAGGDDT